MKLIGIALSLVLCCGRPAYCGDKMKVDNSGKGAVLCKHVILSSAYQFAVSCRPNEIEKIHALEGALKLYEDFISRNGNISLEGAARYTEQARQNVLTPGASISAATCSEISADTDFLTGIVDHLEIEVLRADTQETLSVDREPLMNPCL